MTTCDTSRKVAVMIVNRIARRLATLLAAGFLTTVALVVFGSPAAFAYPAPDGPDMHGSPPTLPDSPATGSPAWVFLLVVAVTAVVAVMSTLTVVRIIGDTRAVGHLGSRRGAVEVLPTR